MKIIHCEVFSAENPSFVGRDDALSRQFVADLAPGFPLMALAFPVFGSLYITDTGNYRLRKVDATGTITTIAGTGGHGYSGDGGEATAAQLQFDRTLPMKRSIDLPVRAWREPTDEGLGHNRRSK